MMPNVLKGSRFLAETERWLSGEWGRGAILCLGVVRASPVILVLWVKHVRHLGHEICGYMVRVEMGT